MQREELLNRTLDTLTSAYENKTLQAENCAACAVGNMLADCYGVQIIGGPKGSLGWSQGANPGRWWTEMAVFRGLIPRNWGDVHERKHIEIVTGYTMDELCQIEEAFESGAKTSSSDKQYAGLQAVYEALLDIHSVEDVTSVQECIFAPTKVVEPIAVEVKEDELVFA